MTLPPPNPWAPPRWAPPTPPGALPPPPPAAPPRNPHNFTPPPYAPATPPKKPNWLAAVVILIVAGFLWLVIKPSGQSKTAAFPRAWDPRVTELVSFVERERELTFKHPVPFEFMTEEAFVAAITGSRPEANPERDQIHEAILRARGFVGPDYNSVKAEEDFVSNVTGFYDDVDQKMRVRGTELTPYAKVTIVHELTHALQDQRFSIKKVRKGIESDEQDFAVKSLIEGDARDIENAYVESLPEAEQQEIFDFENPAGSSRLDNTPDALQVQFGGPYELGALMVQTLRHLGGVERLDAAFKSPPDDEAAVVLPFAAAPTSHGTLNRFATESSDKKFPLDDRIGYESVGTLSTFLTLSSRLDPIQSWRAASGWGDEVIQVVRRNGDICVDTRVGGRTPADTAMLASAYQQWAALGSKVTVTPTSDSVLVESCDPGTSAPAPKTGIFEAIYRLNQTDQVLYRNAEQNGLKDQPRASCAVLQGHLAIDGTTLPDDVFRTGNLGPDLVAKANEAAKNC
jgi:hypothetical protein